jgi:hypothetical protein
LCVEKAAEALSYTAQYNIFGEDQVDGCAGHQFAGVTGSLQAS